MDPGVSDSAYLTARGNCDSVLKPRIGHPQSLLLMPDQPLLPFSPPFPNQILGLNVSWVIKEVSV